MKLLNITRQYLDAHLDPDTKYLSRAGHVYTLEPIGDVETLNAEARAWSRDPSCFFSEE